MPIDEFGGSPDSELLFIIRDQNHECTNGEICDLLNRAEQLGFSLEKGSELEGLTVRELAALVLLRQ